MLNSWKDVIIFSVRFNKFNGSLSSTYKRTTELFQAAYQGGDKYKGKQELAVLNFVASVLVNFDYTFESQNRRNSV